MKKNLNYMSLMGLIKSYKWKGDSKTYAGRKEKVVGRSL